MSIEQFLSLKKGDKVKSVFGTTGVVISTRDGKVLIDWDDNKQSTENLDSRFTLRGIYEK